jgi:hypothetical protein
MKIIITSGVIVLVLLAGAYFLVAQNTTEPQILDPVDDAGWLTYRNEEYGFQIKYPKEYSFVERGASVDRGLTYGLENVVFSERGLDDQYVFSIALVGPDWRIGTRDWENVAIGEVDSITSCGETSCEIVFSTADGKKFPDGKTFYVLTEGITLEDEITRRMLSTFESFQVEVKEGVVSDQPSSISPHAEKPGWETYKNNQLGFSVSYPTEVFRVAESDVGVTLLSSYSITDNPSGLLGKEIEHVFSINFELLRTDILSAIKTESSYAFYQIFPNGTIESFKVIDGFSSTFRSANRDGFSYSSGAEGLGTKYFFLPKNSSEILIIKFNNFDSKVFKDPTASADISLEKQNEIFNAVMVTLDFLN